jgi:hypothetical protein
MAETVLTLDRTTDAPRRARALVRQLEAALGPERTEDATRFTVHDPGAGPLPEMRPSDSPPHEGGGHGLRLVDKVADRWGVKRGNPRMWFELDL